MSATTSDRRTFLAGTLGAAASLTAARSGLALSSQQAPAAQDPAAPEPPFKISIAQWSFHRMLHQGNFDHLSFVSVARVFGVDAVEYVNQFFADKATDREYLTEMRKNAEHIEMRNLLIMIDGEGPLAHPDLEVRRKAIENHRKWVVAAWFLGCHSIRVNAGGSEQWDEGMKLAADSLVQLAEYADPYGIDVIVENHGGLSSNGEWLAGVMKTAGHPRVGTLPDFGNFHIGGGEWYDRYEGVRQLMPWAKAVSAKSHEFDDDGNEINTDFRKMLKIVLDSGYRGYVGVEYEGSKHPESEGVRLTIQLLERVREELAPEYR
jgi:sugar phosphate isomerase/epimerase